MPTKCTGINQSPINIDTNGVTNCGAQCDLMFYYRNSTIYRDNYQGCTFVASKPSGDVGLCTNHIEKSHTVESHILYKYD